MCRAQFVALGKVSPKGKHWHQPGPFAVFYENVCI